jgi:hypothetical protein
MQSRALKKWAGFYANMAPPNNVLKAECMMFDAHSRIVLLVVLQSEKRKTARIDSVLMELSTNKLKEVRGMHVYLHQRCIGFPVV